MSYSGKEIKNPDVSFQVILPNEWDQSLAKINVGITAFQVGKKLVLLSLQRCLKKQQVNQ